MFVAKLASALPFFARLTCCRFQVKRLALQETEAEALDSVPSSMLSPLEHSSVPGDILMVQSLAR